METVVACLLALGFGVGVPTDTSGPNTDVGPCIEVSAAHWGAGDYTVLMCADGTIERS